MSMTQEFKQFSIKGNVVDMAVGVVIGMAFRKIVSSLETDGKKQLPQPHPSVFPAQVVLLREVP